MQRAHVRKRLFFLDRGAFWLRRMLFAALFSCGVAGAARAETIYLKDGRVIEAPILEESDVEVTIELEGRPLRLLRVEIERIRYDDLLAPKRNVPAREEKTTPELTNDRNGRLPPDTERGEPTGARDREAEGTKAPWLAALESSTRSAEVLEAIEAVERSHVRSPAIARLLAARTGSRQPVAVRVAAIEALAEVGGSIAVETLGHRLRSRSVPVRVGAARALRSRRIGVDAAIDLIARALLDPVRAVERLALEALRLRLEDPRVERRVLARLHPNAPDRIEPVRARARLLECVCACVGAAAYDALLRCATDPDPACRACAARWLGRLGRSGLNDRVRRLERLLEDPVFEVQIAAAEALTRLGRRSGFERLLAWTESPDPALGTRAWRALEGALSVRLAHNPAVWRAHFDARFGRHGDTAER